MLCVDYKIGTKALTALLQKVLSSVLHEDQTCRLSFLHKDQTRMNFGPEFRQWVRVIYTNISSACLHSGFATSFFEIHHGARQGDLLSSLLYILVAMVLRAAIRNCKDIRGFACLVHLRSLKSASMRTMEI